MSEVVTLIEHYAASEYAEFEQEHRTGGSFGVQMLQVKQDGHELTDPAVNVLSFVGVKKAANGASFDFGDGWVHHHVTPDGTVDLQPAYTECQFRISGAHELLIASLPMAFVEDQLDRAGLRGDPYESVYGRMVGRGGQFAYLDAMWTAIAEGGAANHLFVDGCAISLLGMFAQQARGVAPWSSPVLADRRLGRAIDYIEAHYGEALRMEQLARVAGLSTVQFARAFKNALGQTPHAYVTERRLTQAKLLLASTALTITEIGFSCGFSSSAHFSSVFSRRIGLSPRAYRRQQHRL